MADPLTMDPVHPGTVYDTPSMLTDTAKAGDRAEDHAQAPAAATHPTASGRHEALGMQPRDVRPAEERHWEWPADRP